MPGIFINYRSDDAVFAATLIDERIRRVFGDENVFLDCRSLRGGTDFGPELWRRLLSSTVLLVLIGPQWLTLTDAAGRRRIDDPEDFVHKEIRLALERDTCVVPVLLQQTKLPRPETLPDDIRGLSARQYVHLRVRQTTIDLDHLVTEIERVVPPVALPVVLPAARAQAARAQAARIHQEFNGSVGNVFNDQVHVNGDIVGGNKSVNGGHA